MFVEKKKEKERENREKNQKRIKEVCYYI